jgi:hypothetical protein
VSDIIETLRRLQCSDAACGDLRIAMGAKLAIYEIERLTAERDEARREVCAHEADTAEDQRQYAEQRGWDCFQQSEEHTTISYKETP